MPSDFTKTIRPFEVFLWTSRHSYTTLKNTKVSWAWQKKITLISKKMCKSSLVHYVKHLHCKLNSFASKTGNKFTIWLKREKWKSDCKKTVFAFTWFRNLKIVVFKNLFTLKLDQSSSNIKGNAKSYIYPVTKNLFIWAWTISYKHLRYNIKMKYP